MYHFFAEHENIFDDYIDIKGGDVNHIKNVLRLKKGDEILISSGDNYDYNCIIDTITDDYVRSLITSVNEKGNELSSKVYLFQGLPKADKMELIIQKMIELGVYEIVPVAMKRSVVKLDDKKYTKYGWEISPEGFLDGLRKFKEEYGDVKIYITENGLGDQDLIVEDEILDISRVKFIEAHLKSIKQAIKESINLKGYYVWSATDLLSWLNGYKKQYGLIYVDHKNNLDRKIKLSGRWYKQTIEERGENL